MACWGWRVPACYGLRGLRELAVGVGQLSVKPAVVGVFTPRKLASAASQGFPSQRPVHQLTH